MAAKKEKGLEASRWARPYDNSRRFDPRSRSVPRPSNTDSFNAAPYASSYETSSTVAATVVAAATTTGSTMPPAQAFHRFEQACQRLRWKFIDLQSSYVRAMNPADVGFTTADAERNFKVDFHEFYMWIEQAIVLVLAVFGITVQRGYGHGIGNGNGTGAAAHAYHHNVLLALGDETNPVHGVMGRGEVNQALWKAKELRNRWKDAADGKETPPLKMYDLTWIVGQVLGGLEGAYVLADERVREVAASGQRDGMREEQTEEDGWEWMVEPMDWEP